jgi:hypothetical protein
LLEPLFESYPKDEKFKEMVDYINWRKEDAKEKIIKGFNKEIEIRYDRYVDYG